MEVEFVYQFTWKGKLHELKLPLKLPYEGNTKELASRLIAVHKIPYPLEQQLTADLERFVVRETQKHQDACADHVIQTSLHDEKILQESIQHWVDKYTENHVDFSNLKEMNEDTFPGIYHSLIHSSHLNTLLQLEHTYGIAIRDIMKARDNALEMLQKRHDGELSQAMQQLGINKTDQDINHLMRKHVTERESLEGKWLHEVRVHQESQRQEYRDWLTKMHQEMNEESPHKNKGKKSSSSQLKAKQPILGFSEEVDDQPIMEESFTIHLGAQQKSSHNLRLLCGNILSFCQHAEGGSTLESGTMRLNPRRIQSALSLYTADISAIIITVDQEVNAVMGMKEVFANTCRQSTDFHFNSIDDQLSLVQQYTAALNEKRVINSISVTPSTGSQDPTQGNSPTRTPDRHSPDLFVERDSKQGHVTQIVDTTTDMNLLHPGWSHDERHSPRTPSPILSEEEKITLQPGDFYLTRHSNLSQVHVVCHLVSEERIILDTGLRARDPIMQGLKSSLRIMAKHGIRHITVPLLLTYQMKPDMTINWCLKRAELVFKSVKGFLLESTTWSGNQSWNMQFLIPEGISEELFEQISDLLSKTFRISVSRNLT